MDSSSLFFLLLFVTTVDATDKFTMLHRFKEKLGNSLVEAARDAGYEAEVVGLVARRTMTCKNVIYDFESWINGTAYDELIKNYFSTDDGNTYVTLQNRAIAIKKFRELNVAEMIKIFEKFAEKLNKWNRTRQTTEPTMSSKPAHTLLGKLDERGAPALQTLLGNRKKGGYEYYVQEIVEIALLEADLRLISILLEGKFEQMLTTIDENSMTEQFYNHVGGSAKFEELAERILEDEFSGSFIQHFGVRMVKMETVEAVGRTEHALVAEVCVPNAKITDGRALVTILPHGEIDEKKYSFPVLAQTYAATLDFTSLRNLTVANPLMFSEDGLGIVENFKNQDSTCNLLSTKACSRMEVDLSAHKGTYVQRLGPSASLVVTNETLGRCFDRPRELITIKNNIFVHHHEYCLLLIGGRKIGSETITETFKPEDYPQFIPSKEKKEEDGSGWELPRVELVIAITGLVILIAFIICFVLFTFFMLRKMNKEHKDELATLKEEMKKKMRQSFVLQ